MTICIAACCNHFSNKDAAILLCSDWQTSSSLGSAETHYKQHNIIQRWRCLSAGYDAEIHATLPLIRASFKTVEAVDETNVAGLLRSALQKRRREKLDEQMQSRFSLSYEEFLEIGKVKFPETMFRETLSRLADIKIEATFILAGFVADGHPMLMQSSETCRVSIHEDYIAIGEGAYLAQASLLQRSFIDTTPLNRAIYQVFEAKRAAEHVASVGALMSYDVMRSDGSIQRVSDSARLVLDEHYAKCGLQASPTVELTADFFTSYSL